MLDRTLTLHSPPRLTLLLALTLVLGTVVACGGSEAAPDTASPTASEPTASTTDASSNSAKAATTSDNARGAKPPLPPEATANGTLPRSYGGWTLGDPAPAIDKTSEDQRYPGATVYLKTIDDSPLTFLCAYVHDGTIFRIEWRSKNPSLARETIVEAFEKPLGPPEDGGMFAKNYVHWNDGLTEGSTTIVVHRIQDSEWIRVAVEDTHRTGTITGLL